MRRLAIIPAFGMKNPSLSTNVLNDRLISKNINNALKSKLFDEVIVVTNKDSIIQLANRNGANTFELRDNLDKDKNLIDVLIVVLEKFKQKGIHVDYGCCIFPHALTASIIKLQAAFDKLISEKLDTVMPIVTFEYPIHKALQIQNGKLAIRLSEASRCFQSAYHDAEQFYFFKTKALLKTQTFLTKNTGAIIIPRQKMMPQLSTESEWKIAKVKFEDIHTQYNF